MVEEPAATPGATSETGESQPGSEVEALEVLKRQLTAARKELAALKENPDKELAELRQKLAKTNRELELAKSVQNSQALSQVKAVSSELANLRTNLQDATIALKRQTGWATVEAIAAEVGAVQKELGGIQSLLTFNRLQMALVVMGICWIAIASAEAFHFSRLAWQKVATLPGMGLLLGGENEQSPAALPTSKTPLKKGDTVAGYVVTSGFGSRVPPCAGCSSQHLGVDLGTPIGTPVYAPYAATVECKGGPSNAAGNYAVLKPKDGKAPEFLYLHLDTCSAGDAKPGQQVATSGNTGNGTGAHLDVRQIEAGNYVNPTREWVERIITGKTRTPTTNLKALVSQFEGKSLHAYLDPVGVPTIGYGTTIYPNGQRVQLGDVITEADADRLLEEDLAEARSTVEKLVQVPLSSNQADSLTSLVYNIGPEAFRTSTLLQKLNAGDKASAVTQFDRWVHGDGRVLPGLVNRREAEKQLFLSE